MTILSVFSYGLVAFGPLIVLFCVTIARRPHEIIVLITSGFFWLVSLLLTSIVWIIIPPLKYTPLFTIPFAVIFQELFRWLIYRLLRKADKVLEVLTDDRTPRGKHRIAYVSGLGFGTVSAIAMFSNILRESGGPGIAGIQDGGETRSQYYVLTMALGANVLVFLHMSWSVIWFSGWNNLHKVGFTTFSGWFSWLKLAIVVTTHMVLSLLSLLSAPHSPLFFLIAAYVCAGILSVLALGIAGFQPVYTIKHLKFN